MKRPTWFGPRPDFGVEPRSWTGLAITLLAAAIMILILSDSSLTSQVKWILGGGLIGLYALIVALTYRHERP